MTTITAIKQELAELVADRTDIGRELSFWYPERRISPETVAWLVMMPQDVDPHATYGPGYFQVDLDGYLIAPTNDAEQACRNLEKYMNPTGDNSIVDAVETGPYRDFDTCVVTRIRNEPVTLFGVIYFATRYSMSVIGRK